MPTYADLQRVVIRELILDRQVLGLHQGRLEVVLAPIKAQAHVIGISVRSRALQHGRILEVERA